MCNYINDKVRLGIVGYGNLGKGVELAIMQNEDMALKGIFTRRQPQSIIPITEGIKVYSTDNASSMKEDFDVMIMCGGSATDLVYQSPEFAENFNIVDSFDTHHRIPEHFKSVDSVCKDNNTFGIISVGWDPGMFSLNRIYAEAILPQGKSYSFWGKGVSQGHSDAIRQIEGVEYAVQYTIPNKDAIEKVRAGAQPEFTPREMHSRECYVVIKNGYDKNDIENQIINMPNYFKEYDTKVNFISSEEFHNNHYRMPHGGFVFRSGITGHDTKQVYEFGLNLESNPQFTSSILIAYARAAYRLYKEGKRGATTVFDVAPKYLSKRSSESLRKDLL